MKSSGQFSCKKSDTPLCAADTSSVETCWGDARLTVGTHIGECTTEIAPGGCGISGHGGGEMAVAARWGRAAESMLMSGGGDGYGMGGEISPRRYWRRGRRRRRRGRIAAASIRRRVGKFWMIVGLEVKMDMVKRAGWRWARGEGDGRWAAARGAPSVTAAVPPCVDGGGGAAGNCGGGG